MQQHVLPPNTCKLLSKESGKAKRVIPAANIQCAYVLFRENSGARLEAVLVRPARLPIYVSCDIIPAHVKPHFASALPMSARDSAGSCLEHGADSGNKQKTESVLFCED